MRRASPRFARGTRRPPRHRDPATAGPCTAQASQKRQRYTPSSLPPINQWTGTNWPAFRARHEKENAGATEAQQGRPSEQRRERRLTRVCIQLHSTARRNEGIAPGSEAFEGIFDYRTGEVPVLLHASARRAASSNGV